MKKLIVLFLLIFFGLSAKSQDSTSKLTAFFSSKISFSENQLSEFYSSFNIDHNHVIFNANNYKIYCFNKQTGAMDWEFFANRKTNQRPFFYDNSALVGKYTNGEDFTVRLDLNSGSLIQKLTIAPLNTLPFFKDSIMYATAIDDGGQVLAYDLKTNHIIWKKFIAHGVEVQPYFLKNKIIANAEGDNWFEIDYKGQLDTTCSKKAELFIEDIKCVRNFKFLTHDYKEITNEFIEKQFGRPTDVKVKYAKDKTFVLGDTKLLIIGNDKKIKQNIAIEKIIALPENDNNDYLEILKIENNTIWFFYKNALALYDFEKNKTLHEYDLSKWNAHQIILDENQLWLISKNDGALYGLKLQ